jgi:hypothetical protein
MKQIFSVTVFLFFSLVLLSQGNKVTLSGYIRDASSGEELLGATVFFKELKTGGAANIYGFYSSSVPQGSYTVEYSFMGYQPITKQVELQSSTTLNVELTPASTQLKEVEITGEAAAKNIEEVQMSTFNLNIEQIKKIPALLGEVDIIRAIQMLPGVQSGGEGTSGFYVRGGGIDQNLILLDEAPVYNASHLMGFFSVFNQDAIKSAELYKGGIPAQFGGRLSSVLDVRMQEGNSKKFQVNGGLGLISSRLTIQGPIKKDKASFIVSGRRTYGDLFLPLSGNENVKNSKLYFYDLNAKVNWRISDKDRVFLSGYFGRDVFKAGELFGLEWGNATFTGRWNHVFSDKVFSNLTFIHSNYDYNLGIPQGAQEFNWNSKIINNTIKNDYSFYLNNRNTITFGFQTMYQTFKPAKITPGEENDSFDEIVFPNRYALESGIYAGNEQRLGANWAINYGLRFSMFNNIGKDEIYTYNDNYDTIGKTLYPSGEFYNTFTGLEPRLAVKYSLNDVSSVKASYNRMYQYLHLASNSAGGSPFDVWMPSSPNIKPSMADQIALGYFRNLKNNTYETSVEVFYKDIQNQTDFKENADILLNPLVDGEVRQGRGYSYGAEFLIRKQKGDFTGWISYTFSRAFRKIPGVNKDETYPANYDRPNNLSVVLSYKLNRRLELSGDFVYITGAPITAPIGRFEYHGRYVPVYSTRNGARMPDYHRMDLSLNIDLNKREDKRFKNSLNISIYNVYARKNPFSINFVRNEKTGEPEAQMTWLFSIIPAVTWNFQF